MLFLSTRREFLKCSAASALGLVIGFRALGSREAHAAATRATAPFAPNAFLRIAPDDTITVVSKHLEHGVGIHTGLATLVAEELDADWAQVRVVPAPANVELYKNLIAGTQATRGSSSLRNSYEQYRKAGAVARTMLVSAAAAKWTVPADEITVERSVVKHVPSEREASFGELAEAVSALPVPTEIALKNPKQFTLIGNEILRRKDAVEKTNGKAQFGIDVTLPGMLTAVVAHSPRFGGKVKSFDASKARAVPGVADVVQISTGVAVLANSFWVAQRARQALHIEWDDCSAERRGTDALRASTQRGQILRFPHKRSCWNLQQ
jgi:isoquinoline 1-oxidoreductase subunit beta